VLVGNGLLIAAGVVLLGLVAVDVLATTLTIGTTAGPFTRRVLGLAWRVMLRLHRRGRGRRWLSTAGVVLLVVTVAVWVAMIWAGWSLVFLGGDGAVVASDTGRPAGVLDTVYYVGFTISTLGVGDFVAAGPGWRLLTAIASFTGLVLVTLAITYLLAVVSAVVARRSLAVHITALGDTAAAVVTGAWADGRFSPAFVSHLVALTAQVAATAEQHLAYPVLHYFSSRQPESAAPPALARLDDALLLLRVGVVARARPDPAAVEPLRRALNRYLAAVAVTSAARQESAPPPVPDLGALKAAGIPVVADEEFAARLAGESDRRYRLRSFVAADGWNWPSP
jgi:hypothetical protein